MRPDHETDLLHQQAVRIPLPDVDAERALHKCMRDIADAGEQKSELLNNPDIPLTAVYAHELDQVRRSVEHHLVQLTGEDYYDAATEYISGNRDDWVGKLAAYYLEGYYRLQEHYTVGEQISLLVVLRYPDCFTINISFLTGEIGSDAVRYESAAHSDTNLSAHIKEQYYADSQYSQHKAAKYLRTRLNHIRDAFPDPCSTPYEQRQLGGFVHLSGRAGATFAEDLKSISPNPRRFDDVPPTPGLVPEGPEAKQAKQRLLINAETVI